MSSEDASSAAKLQVRISLTTRSFTLDVAFDVAPGVTVLFGPSGSGKSRTLGCIAGLVRPDKGRIALGNDVWFDGAHTRERPIHERRVAYGIARTTPKPDRLARAHEMLGKMRVGHLANRKPHSFSGGEAQRVALARAFAMKPRVLLLDEPFSALDAGVKLELLAEVGEWLERERLPAILVTHQSDEASVLGDRVVLIEKGRVVREAEIDDPTLSLPKIRAAAK